LTITLFEVLLFIAGLVVGTALGVIAKRSVGLALLLLLLLGVAAYFGYVNTANLSFTGLLPALASLLYAAVKFIVEGLMVLEGYVTEQSVFSFGAIVGLVAGLAFPRTASRVPRARYVRSVHEEGERKRRKYVVEAD
jgi:uncharacterized membrane protein YccC